MSLGKVLLIEDEAALAEIVRESLEASGFEVRHAPHLSSATLAYRQFAPDIIVADVMLPDGDGFDWVNSIRQQDRLTPVLFLTSRSQTADVVKGFELGGNDYLKKPFSIAELIVRLKALLSKNSLQASPATQSVVWAIGHFNFRYPSGELQEGKQMLQLTSRESDILHLLLQHRNQSVSRMEILQRLWGQTDYFSGRSLDVFITKLRRYLRTDPSVKIINVRGVGYKLSSSL